MSDWREVTLAEVCDRITVGHVGKMADEYVSDGVPFLRSQNVKPFEIARSGMLYVSEAFHRKLTKSALRADDVVVIRTGYPGTAAVVPEIYDGANCADLVVITPSSELNPHMLAAIFNSTWGKSTVSGQLVGSAQQHFNVGSAKRMRVRLPDRKVQDAIADVLCALNQLIENTRRRVEVLEEVARPTYREWFVHFRYPGHESDGLVDSSLGPVPRGWATKRLGELVTLDRSGIQPSCSPEEAFDHFSIPAFDSGGVPTVDSGATIRSGKFALAAPAVMISKLNPRIERTWLAGPGARRAAVSTEFLILRPVAHLTLAFIYALARSGPFQDRLQELSGGTSTSHQRAKPDDFMNLTALDPTAELVKRFSAIAEPQLQLAGRLRRQGQVVASLRDQLLPRLVAGRIDVSSLDLDAIIESEDP